MDLLTFIAEMAKALAWPLAAVVTALVFHQQLRGLLSRMKKGKLGPAEFEFEQRVRELQEEAKALELPIPQQLPNIPKLLPAIQDAIGTVVTAWLPVERAVDMLASRLKIGNAIAPPGSPYNVNALSKAGAISPELVSLYKDLRSLRNKAAHEAEFYPSAESVLAYVQTAKELELELQRLASAA